MAKRFYDLYPLLTDFNHLYLAYRNRNIPPGFGNNLGFRMVLSLAIPGF